MTPPAAQTHGSYYGLSIDGRDNVWFTMITKDRVGVVNSETGEVSEVFLGKESFEGARMPTFEASSSVAPPNRLIRRQCYSRALDR